MRPIALLAFAVGVLAAGSAVAAVPFNPDEATRAWLATMGPEATARSNAYFEGGYWIQLGEAVVTIAISAALLFFGWVRGVRGYFERTVKYYPLVVLCTAGFYILVSSLASLPFEYYVGFVREHQYGLSNLSTAGWLTETLQDLGISIVLGSIGLTILYLVVRAAKSTWWIWGAVVSVMMVAFLSFVYPVFISPIFNHYTPMAESPLKHDILEMAQANGVPADNVYVYDRSRQTNSISANVSGLFSTTRVSLGDTLLNRCDPGCVRAVMGHELGHYVLAHNYSLLVMNALYYAFIFALLNASFMAMAKKERWGVRGIDDPAGLPLIFALVTVISLVTLPIGNTITRFHEQQADMFGLNAAREPDGFAEASVLLSEYRKMHPSAIEEFIFYDHPSGWTRIHNSMEWKAHQIEAGRLPSTPGGPPTGWRPDFVVLRENGTTAAQH